MTHSFLEENLQALAAVYPGQAHLLRSVEENSAVALPLEERESWACLELDRLWNSEADLYVVDRFAGSSFALQLFDRIQLEDLRAKRNRRLMLLEDRPAWVRAAFARSDWHILIESEQCLFVMDSADARSLNRLLYRYPDIAGCVPQVYSGDPSDCDNRTQSIQALFDPIHAALRQYHHSVIRSHGSNFRKPDPQTLRFFVAGHNYLQDACVRALRRLGCGVERLQWKNPLYCFVRGTAWMREWEKNPFEIAVFLNSTPRLFGGDEWMESTPFYRISWFVDHPQRYVWDSSQLAGCDAVGVFDSSYLPELASLTSAPSFELRTAYGIDPIMAKQDARFSSLDIAFVGELGTRGYQPLEQGFLRTDPDWVEKANQILRETDITQPVAFHEIAEAAFASIGCSYHGAVVEYLENKATTLRRRYFLEALADLGLVVFGDTEWRDDPAAGLVRGCYGGRRIDYATELPSLYASAKININIFHVQCVQAPNPRVYDVLASGGFLLTGENPGLADEFKPGEDFVVFHSKEELRELARYYLEHEEERRRIARQGQRSALASCGYHDRMQRLLSSIYSSTGDHYVYLCR